MSKEEKDLDRKKQLLSMQNLSLEGKIEYIKLTNRAENFGFNPKDDTNAHDSLWDAGATLYTFHKLQTLIVEAQNYTEETAKKGEK